MPWDNTMKRNRPYANPTRAAGIAMLLVLFAVAIATVLSVSFLSAQSTTTGISANIQHHARARFIAESAMYMVTRRLQEDEDWRTNYSDGTWASDQSLAGGTFTIVGHDGMDSDGDGEIEGDGDLSDDPEDPLTIIVTGTFEGRTHIVRAVLETFTEEGEAATGGPHGVNVTNSISVTGSGRIDALDSSTSTWTPGTSNNVKASIATNTTSSAQVTLSGSGVLFGDVYVGVGGSTATVISAPTYYTPITGTRNVLASPITIPSITMPTNMPASAGNVSLGGSGSTTLNAGTYRYNNLTVGGSHTLTVNGAVTIICDSTFTVNGSGKVNYGTGATVSVYANLISITGSGSINNNLTPRLPTRLKLYQTGSGDLSINSTTVAACVLAPTAKLVVPGSGKFFGSFHGKALEVSGSGRFTQDLALINGGGIVGGTSETTYYQVSRWVE